MTTVQRTLWDKKDQDLRPSILSSWARQGSSLRSHPCSLKEPTAMRLQAHHPKTTRYNYSKPRPTAMRLLALCPHNLLTLCVKVHEVGSTISPNARAVAGKIQAVAGTMHHDDVPMNRFGINVCMNPNEPIWHKTWQIIWLRANFSLILHPDIQATTLQTQH